MDEKEVKEILKRHEDLPAYVRKLSGKYVNHEDYKGMLHGDFLDEIEEGTERAAKIVRATIECIENYARVHGPGITEKIREYGIKVIELAGELEELGPEMLDKIGRML